jgi:Ca2+-binding EF-hand superfamily protein
MNKQGWLVISAVCTLGAASMAAAHDGGHGMFQKFDTNGDGVVTAQEVEAAANARFAAEDTNKDGKLSAQERQAAHEQHAAQKFEERDANDNGVLERSEVARMPQDFFDRLDTNKDGSLSPTELQAMKGMHHGRKGGEEGDKKWSADTDGDGNVSKAEFLAKAKQMMTKFDANGDGKVTQQEAEAARAKFHHGHHHGDAAPSGSQTTTKL